MKYLKNVASIKFYEEKCIACKMCLKVCPHEVFLFENEKISGKYLGCSQRICMENPLSNEGPMVYNEGIKELK